MMLTHWVYSITTRIKTQDFLNTKICSVSHWVYSITTRIKTQVLSLYLHNNSYTHWVYSITTRIKTLSEKLLAICITLIEYIPLQQGLRPCFSWFWHCFQRLIEYIPLQQGLRRILEFFLYLCFKISLSIFHYNKD